MSRELNILWINPREIQLTLEAGKNTDEIPSEDKILSYDVQANYPITPLVEAIRQLQSRYNGKIHPSILNLAAVPRSQFIDGTWKKKYSSEVIKKIQFGTSQIEVRAIGKDILEIPDLEKIIDEQDLIVVTSPYEMNVNEVKRVGETLRQKYPDLLLIACGIGTETREEKLLDAGFNLVFEGAVTDSGGEVLEALDNNNVERLAQIPGVYTNLGNKQIRNLPARGFRNNSRILQVKNWRNNLQDYFVWKSSQVNFVGREDLKEYKISLTEQSFECYCAFQDLPYDTLIHLSKSGKELVMGAADISISIGCPRTDCGFCTSSGKGYWTKDSEYVVTMLEEYHSQGITDIIPTDDAMLTGALKSGTIDHMIRIFEKINEYEMSLFPGNGLSTYDFSEIIKKSKQNTDFGKKLQNFLNLFMEAVPYFYLPVERLYAITGEETNEDHHSKLENVRERFSNVIKYISKNSPREQIEIATNIMFTPTPDKSEIRAYYDAMDELIFNLNLPEKINIRYVGFFTIPTNGASHIDELNSKYNLEFQRKNPELQAVSIPMILGSKEDTFALEQRLRHNILYRNKSGTDRRLKGGTYHESR